MDEFIASAERHRTHGIGSLGGPDSDGEVPCLERFQRAYDAAVSEVGIAIWEAGEYLNNAVYFH